MFKRFKIIDLKYLENYKILVKKQSKVELKYFRFWYYLRGG